MDNVFPDKSIRQRGSVEWPHEPPDLTHHNLFLRIVESAQNINEIRDLMWTAFILAINFGIQFFNSLFKLNVVTNLATISQRTTFPTTKNNELYSVKTCNEI